MLDKFKLKANDAVLAEGEQLEIYDYIRQNCDVTYVAYVDVRPQKFQAE